MFIQTMSNNLLLLLAFSLLAVLGYYRIPKRGKIGYLLVVNVLFYMLCDIKMAGVLLISVVWTWFCGQKIQSKKDKGWLIAGIASCIVLLCFFKYNEYLSKGVEAILNTVCPESGFIIPKLIMPLGLSYYSFKAISYLADVYRQKYVAEKSIAKYALYVSFFPEILCGPISRFDDFRAALEKENGHFQKDMQSGFYFILKGVFMKTVIANRLSDYVTSVFGTPSSYTGLALWMAAFFYTIELYCDFAGYSSISVGITRLFGLHEMENFNRPYFSSNIKEFWSRWHISLSLWLRDYVYIPLGGSRCKKLRSKLNVMIVFLVSGMWHGAGLNFLIWGFYHGFLNILTSRKVHIKNKMLKVMAVGLNLLLVMIGWIFFRADSFAAACGFVKQMFLNLRLSVGDIQSAILPFTGDNTCVAFFLIVMLFIFVFALRELYEEKKQISGMKPAGVAWQVFLLTSIIMFGKFGTSGFLYANF